MLSAVALFALMDAGLKLLSPHYPPLQVATLRGAASLVISGMLAPRMGRPGEDKPDPLFNDPLENPAKGKAASF